MSSHVMVYLAPSLKIRQEAAEKIEILLSVSEFVCLFVSEFVIFAILELLAQLKICY